MPTENILREAFDEMLALCEELEGRLEYAGDHSAVRLGECDCEEHKARRAALKARAALEREKVRDGS